jgi:hypothetical protein
VSCHTEDPSRNDRGDAALQADDANALRRIAAGDDNAFSAFYREHLDAALAFFMRRVRDRELALDLAVQHTVACFTLTVP